MQWSVHFIFCSLETLTKPWSVKCNISSYTNIISSTSEVMFSGMFVYFFVCVHGHSKHNKHIFMKFSIWEGPDQRKKEMIKFRESRMLDQNCQIIRLSDIC